MEFPSQDIIQIIVFLLPGFVAAWVFYGFTAHPKQSPFERVIQALIFTAFIQATTPLAKMVHQWADSRWVVIEWNKETDLPWSLALAILLGLLFSFLAHTDWLHAVARKLGFTRRTSYPSEWFSTLTRRANQKREVILHFHDNRRIYGSMVEWPDRCDSGHFVMANAKWLLDDNTTIDLHVVYRFLVPATDIRFIEIYKLEGEMTATEAEIKQTEQIAISLRSQDDQINSGVSSNGKQSTTSAAKREAGRGGTTDTSNAKAANITATATPAKSKVKHRNGRQRRKR